VDGEIGLDQNIQWKKSSMTHLLAADIGGTKSDLAIFDLSQTPDAPPLYHQRYRNKKFQSFDEILTDFLTGAGLPSPLYACFGVAAVVHHGTAKLTNRDWTLSEKELQNSFGFTQVTLINDLTAICSVLPLLGEDDLLQIQQGHEQKDGVRAVIAPGTGLGEGFLQDRESCFFPQGSEGGHCDFAPLTREQAELLSYLQKKHSAVSYELLCSGIGLPNIFDFLATTDIARDAEQFSEIAKAPDRTPVIVGGAFGDSPCPLCAKTVSLFLEILGAESGNLALKTYATGGLFIGGGILPRIIEHISFDSFLHYFRRKEKMETLMESIPIHLILKNDAALLGTASYGRHLFHRETTERN
jgi:glucokinase